MRARSTIAIALAVLANGLTAGEDDMPQRKEVLRQVLSLCRDRDTYAAAEYVQSLGDAPIVVRAWSDLVFDLHDEKATPEMTALARAGLLYMLSRAHDLAASAPDKSAHWRRSARALAYNLGSFTWPGWGEKGLTISEADRAAGEEASRLCLRLATELKEDDSSLFASFWLLGAHQLTAGRTDDAIASFGRASERARAGGDKPAGRMAEGYAALAGVLAGRDAAAAFSAAVADLRRDGSEDATFYADQLESVLAVLRR